MLRAILAAAAAAFLLMAGDAAAAPPPWIGEAGVFVTSVNPNADCSPETLGNPGQFQPGAGSCQVGDPLVNGGYVVVGGFALNGGCSGSDAVGYGCEFKVSHDANPPQGSDHFHQCRRTTRPNQIAGESAWLWNNYQPPRPYATAQLATLAECIAKQKPAAGEDPSVDSGGQASFEKQGKGLRLVGAAPSNAGNVPQRLTVTLPKGVSFNPKRTCSRSAAAAMTLDNWQRCSQLMSGRLNDPETTAWFSFAGPRQSGGRRKVWLRARRGDELVGFGTGTILPAAGSYGQKLVVELGDLDINASAIELFAERLRSTKPCGRGRRYKLELTTDAGTAKSSKKAACGRGGRSGR